MVAILSLISCALFACWADPGYRGRSSADWIAQLEDTSVVARADAAVALAEILRIYPGTRHVVASLVRALADSSDVVRLAASNALAQPGVDVNDVVQGLAHIATDSAHADVRAAATRILGSIAISMSAQDRQRHGESIEITLARGLDDSARIVRTASAVALERLAPHLGGGSTTLLRALNRMSTDPDPLLRKRVVTILSYLTVPDSAAAVVLSQALRDTAWIVREESVLAIGRRRTRDSGLVSAVVVQLRDDNVAVRRASVYTLGQASFRSFPAVRAALRRARSDSDTLVSQAATRALSLADTSEAYEAAVREPTREERCRNLPPRTPGC